MIGNPTQIRCAALYATVFLQTMGFTHGYCEFTRFGVIIQMCFRKFGIHPWIPRFHLLWGDYSSVFSQAIGFTYGYLDFTRYGVLDIERNHNSDQRLMRCIEWKSIG